MIQHPNFEKNGQVYLVRCPECDQENYGLNVASGICTWCGFDANKTKENESNEKNSK